MSVERQASTLRLEPRLTFEAVGCCGQPLPLSNSPEPTLSPRYAGKFIGAHLFVSIFPSAFCPLSR